MPLAPIKDMLAEAEQGKYAVGYFECWNLESLLAIADAAETCQSPVLIGYSGIFLPHPDRVVYDQLNTYLTLSQEVCKNLSVPANVVFNESPYEAWVIKAIELGFGLVMFSDPYMTIVEQTNQVQRIVKIAHHANCAVEGELMALPGTSGNLVFPPPDSLITDPDLAYHFVETTGIDAFAVNIGQSHLHGKHQVRLDFHRLAELNKRLNVPLVLHGSSSVHPTDITSAIDLGIRKINVGSRLKQVFFEAVKSAISRTAADYNPYEVVGSGLKGDVLVAGRQAVQVTTQKLMDLYRSSGKA